MQDKCHGCSVVATLDRVILEQQRTGEMVIDRLKKGELLREIKVRMYSYIESKIFITSSLEAFEFLKMVWDEDLIELQEQVAAIYLDQNSQVIAFKFISTGSLNSSSIDKSLLYGTALLTRCSGVVLAHNHPSSNIAPSKSDKDITRSIYWECKGLSFSFELLDHLIISPGNYFSFKDEGLLKY